MSHSYLSMWLGKLMVTVSTLKLWVWAIELLLLLLSRFSRVMSDSVQPHRWQPTRLPCPWDSPGKNTGVGCHFLLQCMKVKSESEVAQSCPALRDPMDCSSPGSSVHEILQARVLEWGEPLYSFSPPLKVTQSHGGSCSFTDFSSHRSPSGGSRNTHKCFLWWSPPSRHPSDGKIGEWEATS